jgi:aryl-alcohol dehydrogenase-like predicted oxidoreductase
VQNRCNVLDTRDFGSGLVERCRELGIAYVPYSSVGGHSGHRRLDGYPMLARVATKHATTPYVVALAWLLAQGPHILPIPGASKVASVESSLTAPRVTLDGEDFAALAALGARNAR